MSYQVTSHGFSIATVLLHHSKTSHLQNVFCERCICNKNKINIKLGYHRTTSCMINYLRIEHEERDTVTVNLSSPHMHVYPFCFNLVFAQLPIKIRLH